MAEKTKIWVAIDRRGRLQAAWSRGSSQSFARWKAMAKSLGYRILLGEKYVAEAAGAVPRETIRQDRTPSKEEDSETCLEWFVIRIKQGKETLAEASIKSKGFIVYLPIQLVERRISRKVRRVPRPLFARYLFVQFDRIKDCDRYGDLNYCRGVQNRGLMCDASDKPLAVPDSIIEAIIAHERAEMVSAGELKTGFKPDEMLAVKIGRWATVAAKYNSEDHGLICAVVRMFGRNLEVKIPFDLISVGADPIDSRAA